MATDINKIDEHEDKIADLEKRQAVHEALDKVWKEAHEEKLKMQFATLSASIKTVKQTASRAEVSAGRAEAAIEGMPGRVIEAIKENSKLAWAEWRTWALFLFGVLGAFGMVLTILDKLGLMKG